MNNGASDMHWMEKAKLPVVVGLYSVAGIYLVRWWSRSTMPISNSQLAFAFGTSAASSYLAQASLANFVSPYSDKAPWVETGLSTAYTWPVMYLASGDMSMANTYLPVQLVSQVTATLALGKWRKMQGIPTNNLPGQISACGAPMD
jgi:hypothetical protein